MIESAVPVERAIDRYLLQAAQMGASDLHIRANEPPWFDLHGRMQPLDMAAALTPQQTAALLSEIVRDPLRLQQLERNRSVDFSHEVAGRRFRCHYGFERGNVYAVFRVINEEIPTFESLGLPREVRNVVNLPSGLVVFCGVTGSGKSTSQAALMEILIREHEKHIYTLEEPIEYLYENNRSLVTQREVPVDCPTFPQGVRDAMRSDPSVIQIGEMRDPDTMRAAIQAATTGHLVFTTIHCSSADDVPTRILDSIPGDNNDDIRAQLARQLKYVVYQKLVPSVDGKRALAYEVMKVNTAIANNIRTNDLNAIVNQLNMANTGCTLFEKCLADLANRGRITDETAVREAIRGEDAYKRAKTGLARG